jgi:hypothetical protein
VSHPWILINPAYILVTVHSIADSSQIDCRTYQYSNDKREKKPPSPHYKAVIVAGAIEHQLPGSNHSVI